MNTLGRVIGVTCRTMSRRSGVRTMADHGHYSPAHYKFPTMNDLPVPSGPWQPVYNAKQQRYNITLAAAVTAFVGTVTYIYTTGLFDMVLPPPMKN